MKPEETTRRNFLKQVAVTSTVVGALTPLARGQTAPVAAAAPGGGGGGAETPWYRLAVRWGQTNITEADVATYDIAWWRQQWKRTELHGIIANAGGIFAYYPSKFPLHYRAANLNGRDLFGELSKAAHDDGLCVLARMDSSKVHAPMYQAHPDWIGVDAQGAALRSGEFYLTCINSPYYTEFLPDVLREIIERYKPEGVTDNIWTGIERTSICYCQYCVKKFRDATGKDLPRAHAWTDPVYRQWIDWSYARRVEQWDFNNTVTRTAGGKDCIWAGMNGAGIAGQCSTFRDMKEIFARSEIVMLDNQSRTDNFGLQENAMAGKLIHSLLGYDKVMPESMAMYQHGRPQFRLSTKSPAEARLWMLSGIAGGIQPWWHHVAAYHEDRRMYKTAEPIMKWHKANEAYLVNRRPIATVAVGWSQRNQDFYGRDAAAELVEEPFRGMIQALIRARIPFVPLHLDHLDRDVAALGLKVLVLANVGMLTDPQIAAIRKFVAAGGSLVASGQTGLFDANGEARPDFALADLFGVKGGRAAAAGPGRGRGGAGGGGGGGAVASAHTYLRLSPEMRMQVNGPKNGSEPTITRPRHAVLAGFEETDILPFGGNLTALTVDPKAQVLATFIPSFPTTPPETAYMRTARTEIPGLILNETGAAGNSGGRVVYFAADIDRRFASDNFPDHGDLLANAVRWAAGEKLPLMVQGAGLVNCELYWQESGGGRMVLHLLNLTNAGSWRAPTHELIAIGPLQVRVTLPERFAGKAARALVGGKPLAARVEAGVLAFEVASILDHEVVVIEA